MNNAATFHPGAVILFKRGETWDISAAAALTVPRSNLTFAAYGAGANPIYGGMRLTVFLGTARTTCYLGT